MNKSLKLIQKPVHFLLYRILMKNFLRLIFGVSYKNINHFKGLKQFIVVANHNSHLDTMSVLAAMPSSQLTKVHPVAAGDYFGKNKLTQFLTEFFINTLLISRNKSGAKNNALDDMDQLLKDGKSILIFPEGSRGEAEIMQDFKHGASILLKKNPSIPFIPIFMKGMGKALPKGDPFLIPTECQVRIGNPMWIENIEQKEIPEITEIIKQQILRLQD
ncbi:MAG: lysophospholipid acyltransferase family protein [Bacteriovorax sp.]|nr:lysophospholipid acyltransferase family protein [Bacteriovorax sp.]